MRSREIESRTERDRDFVDRLIRAEHWKTTITDGKRTIRATGFTPRQAETRARDKWSRTRG